MRQVLAGVRVAVLAADGFEQIELTFPLRKLRKAGADVKIISLHAGKIRGVNLIYPGKKVPVDATIDEVSPDQFDALFIPGGFANPDFLRQSERVLDFVAEFDRSGKPIASLCHGPWVLASARRTRARRLTSWPGIADDLRNAGAHWENAPVVKDANWITSRGPQDLRVFDKALIDHFAEKVGASREIRIPKRWPKRLIAGAALASAAVAAVQAANGR